MTTTGGGIPDHSPIWKKPPPLTGWRTLGFSLMVVVVGVLQQADWATLVNPKYAGAAIALIGAISAGLRAITSTPIGQSE